MSPCPVCFDICERAPFPGAADAVQYNCPRCGLFALTRTAEPMLPLALNLKANRRALMSHKLRRMYHSDDKPVWVDNLNPFLVEDRLPSPQQQADALILWIGDTQLELAPSDPAVTTVPFISAWIGTAVARGSRAGLWWMLEELEDKALFTYEKSSSLKEGIQFRLTMAGWEYYERLKKTQVNSRTAFMAMKFGDEELDGVVANCFKPAVRRAGFQLRVLTDQQPAGLIDDQIRAAIISGRFVIADLTHGNQGAYWEAGFAEGRGLPVIYTCARSRWEQSKTHFDTNHLVTILWDTADLDRAGRELTATIRATLPDDAKQSED